MGLDRKSYSPLKQINKANIKRLVPVWNTSLMNDSGELSAPVVYNGVLYAINGKWTFAIDVETGRQIWRTPVEIEPGVLRVTQFGAFTRGAPTIYNGKLFRVTVDNNVVALDMKTGKEVWKQKFADWRDGYYATGAPIIANGVLISGMAGGEFDDARLPRRLGSRDRQEAVAALHHSGARRARLGDLAGQQRRLDPRRRRRPGAPARTIRSSTWSIGAPAMPSPTTRGRARRWTASTPRACSRSGRRRARSSAIFQYTPNDVYDVDGADEHVLADLQVGGQTRKVMIQANKNGFMYVLDRTNCKPIAAKPSREGELGDAISTSPPAGRC